MKPYSCKTRAGEACAAIMLWYKFAGVREEKLAVYEPKTRMLEYQVSTPEIEAPCQSEVWVADQCRQTLTCRIRGGIHVKLSLSAQEVMHDVQDNDEFGALPA